MSRVAEDSLGRLETRILARLSPEDRSLIASLLRNIILLIKRKQGRRLTWEEKTYPPHPLFSHQKIEGGRRSADTYLFRLKLIDRYKLDNSQYILDILTQEIPSESEQKLSTRQAEILWQLYQNPRLPQYKLAKQIGSSPRTISKELAELQNMLSLRIYTMVDHQKFKMASKVIVFLTESIEHTEKLEKFIITNYRFLRTFQLDQDRRKGAIVFRIPDQRDGHKMLEERMKWLQDEFFVESQSFRLDGAYYSISFSSYDPTKNTFSIEPEIVSEAPFKFIKQHLDALPKLQGMKYTSPIWFNQADFLLADTLFSSGQFQHPEYKQRLLKNFGIDYSMKTIWKREQRLKRENVATPWIELKIPGFDEDLAFAIKCSPEATKAIQAVSAVLPYVMFFTTDLGCLLRIQRPAYASSLTGQLVRKIYHEKGVSDVMLLRYQWRFLAPMMPDFIDRWDVEKQRWNLHEGDI